MDLSFLPAVNACLNLLSASLLTVGRVQIQRQREDAHRRAMLAAFATSSLFLVLYVLHKASRGFENTPFHGEGALRGFYLAVLVTHVTLAMTVPVLAVILIRLALTRRLESHRRLARVAWPVWMYVSVTGVIIYLLLYPLNPTPG